MIHYYISGVWKVSGTITHVFIHSVDNQGYFGKGEKATVDEVIRELKARKVVYTIRWNYKNPGWLVGAKVDYRVKFGGSEYLTTMPDTTVENNLDNLILMNSII